MKLRKGLRPSRVTSKDPAREVLSGAVIVKEEGPISKRSRLYLHVTNVFAYLRIRLDGAQKDDYEGPVPGAALRHLEEGVGASLGRKEITIGVVHYDRAITTDIEDPEIPPFSKVSLDMKDEGEYFVVELNPTILKDLSDAMGHSRSNAGIQLAFDKSKMVTLNGKNDTYNSPIYVVNPRCRNAEGTMMPIKITDYSWSPTKYAT